MNWYEARIVHVHELELKDFQEGQKWNQQIILEIHIDDFRILLIIIY